jgi:hypothetical protein
MGELMKTIDGKDVASSGSCLPRVLHLGLILLAAIVAVPGAVMGQACIGEAARTAQFSIGGDMAVSDQLTGYGLNSQANLPGRVSMGARIGVTDLDDADDNLTSVGANLALDLGRGGLSVCPVVAVGYDFWSGDFAGVDLDFSVIRIPVGLGVGSRFGTEHRFVLIPAAQAGLLHSRFSGNAAVGDRTFGRTDTATDFYADAGLTAELGRLFVRGGVFHVFEESTDTLFRVGLGVVF